MRIRGELRHQLGQIEEAEADFCEAIALAKEICAKALELRAAMSLVRMLSKRGDLAKGRNLLAPLYASFTEGLESADLRDAKSLLDSLTT
jgi:predicted ATPase